MRHNTLAGAKEVACVTASTVSTYYGVALNGDGTDTEVIGYQRRRHVILVERILTY